MSIRNIVPKDHRFCRDARRCKRVEKLLCGVSDVYWLLSKDIDDREAIGPV